MKWYNYFNKNGKDNLISAIEEENLLEEEEKNIEEENLLEEEEKNIEEENLLVCQQLQYRRYTRFKNFAEFSIYLRSSPEEEKCFYEMMREDNGRKPYFDIDIDDTSFDYVPMLEEIKKILIDMISRKIKILIFDSSTVNKISFHIVVDGFYLQTYKELLTFFDSVKSKISEPYKSYLDRSVYKSVQQFRIVNSHKYMKDNTKKLREDLSHKFKIPASLKSEVAKFNYLLASSLVTNVSGSEIIYGFQPQIEEKELNIFGNAQESDVEDVMKLFYDKFSYGDFNFQECKEKNGNLLIILRRINPTYCEICKRHHENENPYITVVGEYRNVTFYCRRGDDDKEKLGISLGYLGIPIFPTLEEVKPVDISKIDENIINSDPEEIDMEEDLEEILEDISEVPKFSTPKRKMNASKSLKNVKLRGLIY